jgi:hypothetical protein
MVLIILVDGPQLGKDVIGAIWDNMHRGGSV